jgi:heme-degrading monooxygenase HmoA
MAVTWINCFEVPEGHEEKFFAVWQTTAAHFRAKPGFISYRMYRALRPGGRFQFVNVTLWESAEQIDAAHDDRFRELIQHPDLAVIKASPGMFDVIVEG